MAECCEGLPLTASCLSPLPGFQSWPWLVASDLGLSSYLRWVPFFYTTYNWLIMTSRNMEEK